MLLRIIFLVLATAFLAYSNGANDNFKGVASLFGSGTTSYRTTLWWATATTFAGSIGAWFVASSLLTTFSGRGIVGDQIAGSPFFLVAVALGAGLTVIIATLAGLPVSTTHGLTGAIVGSGLVAAGTGVNVQSLGVQFLLPLVLSPILATVLAGTLYMALGVVWRRFGITKESCVCVGEKEAIIVPQMTPVMAVQPVLPVAIQASTGDYPHCAERYAGTVLGIRAQDLLDHAHFVSAGIVSFARGLNDTPKIAAILLTTRALDTNLGVAAFAAIAATMAVGGLLNAREVAETMSHRITSMSHGQGFAANLSTGFLVLLASRYGLPVSTTHVAVGALFGIGLTTRTGDARVVRRIVFSWLLTLPGAAILGGISYAALAWSAGES